MSSAPEFTLHLATAADLPKLLPLVRDFHKEGHLPFHDVVTVQAVAALFEKPELGRVYLVKSGGAESQSWGGYVALTSFHSIEFGGSCLFFDEVYLTPESRGQGLGTLVMAQIIALCKEEGLQAFFLEVDPENGPAKKLYNRLGFQTRPYTLEYLILRPVENS